MPRLEDLPIEGMITRIAMQYGIDPALPLAIAYCESRYNSQAKSKISTATGLFQFLAGTWQSTRRAMQVDENLDLRLDPIESTRTAIWKIANGGLRAWQADPNSESCWSSRI